MSFGSVDLSMADGSELDFFDIFVFDRDEEAGGLPPESPEEQIPLIDLTADSDDDGPCERVNDCYCSARA